MQKITQKDTFKQASDKFDNCMDDFFTLAGRYVNDVKSVLDSDESNAKIHSHSLNLAEDMKLIAENVMCYSVFVKNSLFGYRKKDYERLLKDIRLQLSDFRSILQYLLENDIDAADDNESSQLVLFSHQLAMTENVLANNWLSFVDASNRYLIMIEGTITSLANLEEERKDRDYEDAYNYMKESYYSSETWRDIAEGYITLLYETEFQNAPATVLDLSKIHTDLTRQLHGNKEIGQIWLSSRDNVTKRARRLAERNFETDDNINYIFYMEGKISIVKDWMNEIRFKEGPYEWEECDINTAEVVFCNNWTADWFRDKWPSILSYMQEKNIPDYAWCCLHHVLTFYSIIEKTDFVYFMRWLNTFAGITLITEVNIRKCKNNYFVKTVKQKWKLDELEKSVDKVTPQLRTNFKKYIEYCDDLRDIIKA